MDALDAGASGEAIVLKVNALAAIAVMLAVGRKVFLSVAHQVMLKRRQRRGIMPEDVSSQLVVLFQQMSEMTRPECDKCRVPRSCCDSMYCECAEEVAREDWGVDLTPLKTDHPTLPFMGPNGCVVAPHFRPLCTFHTCEMNGMGFKKNDLAWTEKYFELREQINDLEEIRSIQKGEVK